MGRFPSGQRGQTVNLLATPSKVRILLCPLFIQRVRRRGGTGRRAGLKIVIACGNARGYLKLGYSKKCLTLQPR